MRVKVIISSQGHLFGETFILDINIAFLQGRSSEPRAVTLQDVAEHFMRFGVVIADRWISPFRLMEFTIVEPEAKLPAEIKEGQANG